MIDKNGKTLKPNDVVLIVARVVELTKDTATVETIDNDVKARIGIPTRALVRSNLGDMIANLEMKPPPAKKQQPSPRRLITPARKQIIN